MTTYEARVRALESQGLTRSDAQGVVEAEDMRAAQTATAHHATAHPVFKPILDSICPPALSPASPPASPTVKPLPKIIILIRGGMVQAVKADHQDFDVDVLDLDDREPVEDEESELAQQFDDMLYEVWP